MSKVWRYDLVPTEVLREAEQKVGETCGDDGAQMDEAHALVHAWQEYGHSPGEPGHGYESQVTMPDDASILSINYSTKGVSIYALTEGIEGAPATQRGFFVCGNDCELPEGVSELTWRGTAKVAGGPTAHVFELVAVTA